MTLMIGFNTASAISFKFAALRQNEQLLKVALIWFIAANALGFVSAISFQQLLRYMPLNLAFAITGALWFLCVQVFGALLIFHETITLLQWVGVCFLIVGLIMISAGIRP